jgi:hypothetical protein
MIEGKSQKKLGTEVRNQFKVSAASMDAAGKTRTAFPARGSVGKKISGTFEIEQKEKL